MHSITHRRRILSAENGFLLGNGDLSVSVYQTESEIIWRFGKGNVWDRRLDLRDDPPPARIEEVRRGILEEGWKVGTIGEGLTALRGTRDEKRMREICQGSPKSYETRPYPCPKPVGELSMHLPPDLTELEVEQTLWIEDGVAEITCRQEERFLASVSCWVDSRENILCVEWRTDAEPGTAPVWFSLYRWADPRVEAFAAGQFAAFRTSLVTGANDPSKATPLPPPVAEGEGDLPHIRQDFYPEKTFPEGSCCLIAPLCGGKAELPRWPRPDTAALHILPEKGDGAVAVGVTATGDAHSGLPGLRRLRDIVRSDGFFRESRERLHREMERFWSRSSFRCGEKLLENLWYETIYAFRCIYRGGTTPPGLFFPSTVKDYAHWHGDYHSNYNFQQPFWGICEANHPEGLDAYFAGMEYFFRIGRKIAREYYGTRGVFVQLSAFPIDAEDDPIGVVPLGRMAYMTGWACTLYWRRYLLTMDREWLARTGYPAIRDCALFYTDFLTLGEDGKYHAFPSNQGEDAFSGNPADFCDREEVAAYLCYCLRCAIAAAGVLGCDPELSARWKELLDNYAADPAAAYPAGSPERRRAEENPPEFGSHELLERCSRREGEPWPAPEDYISEWYFGHYPLHQLKRLHMGCFDPALDYPAFLADIRRWRHPNGLCWAMSVERYGQIGAWTETLGVLGSLMECAVQSWDGCIRLFPGLPPEVDLSFENFRTRGAFLVSAVRKGGETEQVRIFSEAGGECTFLPPWEKVRILDEEGREVPHNPEEWGGCRFMTEKGAAYRLEPALS